jgi:Zn finger protein HypA/HybF involved in hydrogenase expression
MGGDLMDLFKILSKIGEDSMLAEKDLKTDKKPKYTNCPNCGAVLESDKCEYCGSIMV